jgi:hypothetical protein
MREARAMQYEQFEITAFEKQPNLWGAKIKRADGTPVLIHGTKKMHEFVTSADYKTAQGALLAAMTAIDAGTFTHNRD